MFFGIVRKTVNPYFLSKGGAAFFDAIIKALEKTAVQEGHPAQKSGEGFGFAEEAGVAPDGVDHVVVAPLAVPFVNETAIGPLPRFVHLRIQRGKEEVLQDG